MCGRAARWWDAEIKSLIETRREVYRKIIRGQPELCHYVVTVRLRLFLSKRVLP